ncbi:hypothetical protein H696_00426 [Fonticula alba]|uniref:Dolichyl-diphosphooligosaccharide--protein glycosyltransferase subunit 1 n=1 Tax=Fonticula alba TaxID=691883 RepID=A0A058ZFX0_FONAL|nr:hypothetical protein H696_00426 [Fonticula alba]KCV72851.1 hypothetical protein H696_00426 [Fonticula alba]|eukprot:XP_009492552.1 hypothetical protein H696_00426 [Fonticula alba]
MRASLWLSAVGRQWALPLVAVWLALTGLLALAGASASDALVVNSRVARQLDFTISDGSAFHSELLNITVSYEAPQGDADLAHYRLTLPVNDGMISSVSPYEEDQFQPLESLRLLSRSESSSSSPVQVYEYSFATPLPPQASRTLAFYVIKIGGARPTPATIEQGDPQFLATTTPLHFVSPYKTTEQIMTAKMTGDGHSVSLIPSNTPTDHRRKSIASSTHFSLGPFVDVPATDDIFATGAGTAKLPLVSFRIREPAGQAIVEDLTRTATVSHLTGTLHVDNSYHVLNTGAALRGGFSRAKMSSPDRSHGSNPDGMAGIFRFPIPSMAKNIYFVDQLGNVSSSIVDAETPQLNSALPRILTLKTRYPLFGGWRAEWSHGYTVPLDSLGTFSDTEAASPKDPNFLFGSTSQDDPSLHMLRLPLLESHSSAAILRFELNIVLPEGARDVHIKLPFNVDFLSIGDPTFSFLDSLSPVSFLPRVLSFFGLPTPAWVRTLEGNSILGQGRPTIVIRHQLVASLSHENDIEVTYRLNGPEALLIKPVSLSMVIFLMLAALLVWSRSSVSIEGDADFHKAPWMAAEKAKAE